MTADQVGWVAERTTFDQHRLAPLVLLTYYAVTPLPLFAASQRDPYRSIHADNGTDGRCFSAW
ncbi:hypothetical protein ThrDRAFT_04388 [Frankia casuarinae]|nr:hypothetical protein CcI6DRAFT_03237 [Frankia sp. CcI6]EYT89984.1 hypothetical protein ThrDRAFT_04388 [Frankia casuarinae]KDA42536.1 hypothetical protein BMG523Draft_02650 [Frankia sp. BMG5.23]KEZ35592.1 hypothetical protein CEDDRAFT_03027 [Frankia sp. CeD]KFB03931.1 hypothetical protein ALLO2DRAFT_03282 [Frankia sp. Allo2]